jgi:hypothetical protein
LADGRSAHVYADFVGALVPGSLNSNVRYDSGDFSVDGDSFRITIFGQFLFVETPTIP